MKIPRIPFQKALCVSLLILAGLIVFLSWNLLPVSDATENEYRKILAKANPTLGGKNSKTPYTAYQERHGVNKDYFFLQGCQRMQLHLTSTSTIVEWEQQSKQSALVEHMKNVRCQMHEELFYKLVDGREAILLPSGNLTLRNGNHQELSPEESQMAIPMQLVRYFEADNASYHYGNGSLNAENATILRYIAKGHSLPENRPESSDCDLCGITSSLELTLNGSNPKFNATGFKALFPTGQNKL